MPDLSGKHGLVVGVANRRSIAWSIAQAAGAAGARLALTYQGERLEENVRDLAAKLDQPLVVPCDVAEWDQQEALVQATLDRFGRIDVVFANAGFGARRGFTEETPEFWRSMVLTNVLGAAYTIRATINPLRKSKGHLILTSSVAGRRALEGSFYSATKHAVTAMGEAVRQELNESGVRMTLIEPGMVDTPFFDKGAPEWALKPEDVARAIMFAVSQPDHVDVNEVLIRPVGQPN